MRSIRNTTYYQWAQPVILDHWGMRSIRNYVITSIRTCCILDHWEMRSSKSSSKYIPRFICFR